MMAPVRPHPRVFRSREGIARQVDYWLTVYRRTWKGTAISSFVAPLFYVVAMGVLLGGFIEGDPAELEGATSYLAFLVPGLLAAHAMQTAVGETTYPVMAMIKWQRIYDSMLATPLQVRDLVLAHLAFVTIRVATTCAVFMLVVAPFGVFESWWGAAARVRDAGADRHGVRVARLRVHDPAVARPRASACCSGSASSRCSCSPAPSSRSTTSARSASGSPGSRRCGTGVNLSRMFFLDNVDWGLAAVNAGVLLVLTLLGLRWSIAGLTKRLVS